MKHTKGTWNPERTGFTNESDMNSGYNTHKFIIKSDEPMNRRYGNRIANILGNESDAKANAHLIASAPEMLAMLKQMVGELDDTWMLNADVGKIGGKTKYDVKRLIAKAERGAS